MTTFDFQDGNGLVPAHKHVNGGGWVASTAIVDDTAYVGPNARVYGKALVFENARVFGYARVYDNAYVFGDAQVFNNSLVCGRVAVFGNARISGETELNGKGLYVYNNSRVVKDTDTIYLLEDGTIYFSDTGKVLENIKNPEQYFKNLARLRGEYIADLIY